MNPLNFYKNPRDIDYEKDIDPVGRDLIKAINQTDYLRTTMYCSGHFEDEQQYPWMEKRMELCLVALDITKAYEKLSPLVLKLKETFGFGEVYGGGLYLHIDKEDNKHYHIVDLLVGYETKEDRENLIKILYEGLIC